MIQAADKPEAFDWVDDYFAHVRPHFDVRAEDRLLIVLPNQAVKLNATGLGILQHMKGGGGIGAILQHLGGDAQKRRDVFHFLCDFRSLISGCLGEAPGRKAVQVVPHTEGFNTLPVLSEIALTYACNLRCRFCYAGCGCQGAGTRGKSELPTPKLIRLLEVIRKDAKVPSVSFTGGEPLLHKDLPRLVAEAKKLGLRSNLITNGTLVTPAKARQLAQAGLSSAQVSLEGPNADVHDALTQVKGSFERTLAGLDALRQAGVHTHTNTTINAINAPHMEALVAMLAGMGLERMSANLIIPSGSASDLELQISYSDIGPVVRRVHDAARQRGIEFMWYSPTPMCLFNPLAEGLGNKSCAACDGLLSVSPSGDVLPCSSYPQPVGNLLREPFAQVWQSARAVFFRHKEFAPGHCRDPQTHPAADEARAGCEDFVACAGACPLYWSAMGTGELAAIANRAGSRVLPPATRRPHAPA